MIAVTATQCVNCGHVAAPARQLYQCDACQSFEVHIFEAQADDSDLEMEPADVLELAAPRLSRSAVDKLLAAIRRDERWTLTDKPWPFDE